MKKILIIGAAVIVVGILTFFGWQFFSAQKIGTVPPPSSVNINTSTLPKGVKVISKHEVSDFWTAPGTEEIYYLAPTGEIYLTGAKGDETSISNEKNSNLGEIKISPDGKSVLASFGMKGNETFSIFNTKDKLWQSLPQGTVSATWDKGGTRIGLLIEKQGLASLQIMNVKDKKTTTIMSGVNLKDMNLDWPLANEIYVSEKGSAKALSSIIGIDVTKKTTRVVSEDEYGLMARWSHDGKTGLKFTNHARENTLALIDQSNRVLAIPPFTTLPSKCAIESNMIYCAVPQGIPPSVTLPDDYLKGTTSFKDSIVAWNTEKNTATEITAAPLPFDIAHLEVSGDVLIALNRYDKKLYTIPRPSVSN